ncbi:MAG: helix-turn-helix domain-containing protein, partial [Crocinitomicaceae bacterium]
EKNKNVQWIKELVEKLANAQEHSLNFRKQIDKLFHNQVDLQFINERVSAAYTYFFPLLDDILGKFYHKIGELKLIRKTKQYTDELEEFSELLFGRIIDLKKTRILTEKLAFGIEISKDVFKTPEIENYQLSKISAVQQVLRQQNKKSKLVLDTIDFETRITTSKKEKPIKKSTSEITLELIKSGKKIDEIARERQLSETTIYGHVAQLIRAEKVHISEVMEAKRLSEIQGLVSKIDSTSLTQIKSQIGELVSWDELRIYQASTII